MKIEHERRNALIDGNPMWDWNEEIAQRLLEQYPRKLIEEVRASLQMVCNCFRCTELYLNEKYSNGRRLKVQHKLENGKLVHEILEETESMTIKKALDSQTAGEGYEWIPENYSRRQIRRVKLSEIRELKQAKFLLRRHWWKGQFVVRGMAVDHWDLVIDKGAKCLDEFSGMEDPLENPDGVNCIRKDCCNETPKGKSNKEWMNFFGEIPPNHPEWGNPNKRISAYMDKVDSGSVNIAEDSTDFVSFIFKGSKLKGYWIAKRESPRSENWVFSKSALPGQPRKETKHARHSREKCMDCSEPPKYEILWAEGIAHAWWCEKHFEKWTLTNMKTRRAEGFMCDINMVREVENGIAAKKWKDNHNPDIWPELRKKFLKQIKGK